MLKPYYQDNHVTIYCGDCAEILPELERVDLTVTSPPYGNLRDYEGYVFNFEAIAQGLWTVTKPGGVVVWVVNDETVDGSESGESFRQALRFKEIGFRLHDTMIYGKDSFLHQGGARYYQIFEFMFILSKDSPKTWNPIKRKTNNHDSGKKIWRRLSDGDMLPHKYEVGKIESDLGNIWHYGAGFCKSTKDVIAFQHPAIFPEALANDHIRTWANAGDTVLDPMMGSGTTLKMARINGCKGIGIDISEKYCEIAAKRLEQGVLDFG